MRFFNRDCPPEVKRAYWALTGEMMQAGQAAFQCWRDMLTYVEFGRDRRKLTLEWVEEIRAKALEQQKWADDLRASMRVGET